MSIFLKKAKKKNPKIQKQKYQTKTKDKRKKIIQSPPKQTKIKQRNKIKRNKKK